MPFADLGAGLGAGFWNRHHSPERHVGCKDNAGGPERCQVLLRSIYLMLREVKCMVSKAALCPIAVPAKPPPVSETELANYTASSSTVPAVSVPVPSAAFTS